MSSGVTPGPLEGQLAGAHARRLGEVLPFAHRRVRDRLAGAEHPHRGLGAVPGPLLAGQTMAPPPSERMQQWSLVNGSQIIGAIDDVVDRDRVPVVGVGVEAGVVAGGHGHLGQLLDGRAELVHVAPRHHGVVRPDGVAERRGELDRAPGAEGEVGHAQLLLQVGPLRWSRR